jgi:2',3'-cyclic-nucleotide 2'-phosphodiesterase (5'-nucleotidase family)
MAVGARDLNASAPWLQREASAAKVEVLSVNLFGADNKPVFKPSVIVEEGGVKVGFIGATAIGPHGDLNARAALPLVKAEAEKLRGKTDLIILLAAVSYADSLQLSNELKGSVDLIAQSNENRGISIAQKGPGNYLLPSGERGRHVGKIELVLGGKGPLQDLSELERNKQVLAILDKQIEEVRRRKKLAKEPSLKAELDKTEADFQARKQATVAEQGGPTSNRTFKLQFVGMGSDIKDDPEWVKEIDRIDPPGKRGH